MKLGLNPKHFDNGWQKSNSGLTSIYYLPIPSAEHEGNPMSDGYSGGAGPIDDNDNIGDACDEDDNDNDGVPNQNDNCPNTPQGTRVDVNGCPVFELPLNNFKVEVGSATCIGNTDGVINLSVEDASYDYSVAITGQSDFSITGTSTTASVTGLAKGTYEVCFKVVGQDGMSSVLKWLLVNPSH